MGTEIKEDVAGLAHHVLYVFDAIFSSNESTFHLENMHTVSAKCIEYNPTYTIDRPRLPYTTNSAEQLR